MRIFSPNLPKILKKIKLTSAVNCVEYFSQWQLACGTTDGTLSVLDLRTYQNIFTASKCHLPKYDEGLVCLLGDGERSIMSGGTDGMIKVYR